MKIAQLSKTKDKLSEYVKHAQEEHVLITNHGKPAAILIGVDGEGMEDVLMGKSVRFWEALEDLLTSASPKFWAGIERSRKSKQPGRALRQVRAETDALLIEEKRLGREMTADERRTFLRRRRTAKDKRKLAR